MLRITTEPFGSNYQEDRRKKAERGWAKEKQKEANSKIIRTHLCFPNQVSSPDKDITW